MKNTFKFALVQTLPVFFGYLFLGAGFGIMLQQIGYNAFWAFICAVLIYAGSGQYLLVGLLASNAGLSTIAYLTFLVNSRHIFYGLTFIEKFRALGKKAILSIFTLTDETYSVLCSMKPPKDVDANQATVLIGLLDHCYWAFGCTLGAILGDALPIDFTGIDFSMTALFVVIFLDQWKGFKTHLPAMIGAVSSVVFLLLLGSDNFLLPSLIVTVTALMGCKQIILRQSEEVAA
jgi:4-azaleucine resistance transporter AzlC